MNKNEVATAIQRRNRPVVVFDSCSLLDIPRLKYSPRAIEILDMCVKYGQDQYTYLVPQQVIREIDRNLSSVISKSCTQIQNALPLIDSSANTDAAIKKRLRQIRTIFEEAFSDIITQSLKIDDSETIIFNAMDRMIKQKKPAHPSKSSYGDCLILESLIECATQLRRNGFDKDIMFVTTNPDDFSENKQERKCELHQEFVNDFSRLKILYLTDLQPMFYESGLQHLKTKQGFGSN